MFKTRLKFIIQPAEINDAAILADVHKENFFPSWGKEVFANFLQQAQFVTFIAVLSDSTSCSENHKIIGFLVARQVLDESELITLAVSPAYRKHKVASLLLEQLLQFLYRAHSRRLYLEVAENNAAALALYKKFLFQKVGHRKGYYETKTGRVDALLLQRDFIHPKDSPSVLHKKIEIK